MTILLVILLCVVRCQVCIFLPRLWSLRVRIGLLGPVHLSLVTLALLRGWSRPLLVLLVLSLLLLLLLLAVLLIGFLLVLAEELFLLR